MEIVLQNTANPLVTIIICVYNAGEFLRASVQSVLEQTYRNLEILIVNDGSTDDCIDTIQDVSDARIRIVHQENKGKPSAMNLALDQMHGEFYAVQDADDLSDPRRVECQLECMLQNPEVAATFCGYDLIIDGRKLAPISKSKDTEACHRDIAAFRMPGHDPTGMYRMSLVHGERYNSRLPVVEGLDYVLRIGEKFAMMVVGECLYSYRIHSNSVTRLNVERRHQLVGEALRAASSRRGLNFEKTFPEYSIPVSTVSNRQVDNNLAAHFLESACELAEAGKRLAALHVGLSCSFRHPLDAHYHKATVCALMPMWIVRKLRRQQI